MKKGVLKKQNPSKKEKQDKILQIWDALIDKMIDKIIENCILQPVMQEREWNFCCKHFLNESQIRNEIVMERNLSKKCGYPACQFSILSTEEFLAQFPPHQKAKIDFATNQIINIREDFNFLYFRFCSESCKSHLQDSISIAEEIPKNHFQIYSQIFQVPQILNYISHYFPNLNITTLQLLKQKLQAYLNKENEELLKKNKITVKLQITEREDETLASKTEEGKSILSEEHDTKKKVSFEEHEHDEHEEEEIEEEESSEKEEEEHDHEEDHDHFSFQKFSKNPFELSDDEEYKEDLKQSRLYLQKPPKFIFLSNLIMDWHSTATEQFFDLHSSREAEELKRREKQKEEEQVLHKKLETYAELAKEEMNINVYEEQPAQSTSTPLPRKRVSKKRTTEISQPASQDKTDELKEKSQSASKIKFTENYASQNQEPLQEDDYFVSLLIQRQKIVVDKCLKTLPDCCTLLQLPFGETLSDLFKDLIKTFSFKRVLPSLQAEDWIILNCIFFLSLQSKLSLKEHIEKSNINQVYEALAEYSKKNHLEILTISQVDLLVQTIIKGYKL